MGERMMIQYSVEATELKSEVKRLLVAALSRLTSIRADSPESHNILTISTLKEISSLREELARIDIMLEDVAAIIDGYVKYEHDSFIEGATQEAPPQDPQILPHIQNLQKKVKDLQENMRELDEDAN